MLSVIQSSRLLCQSSAELIHDGAVVINGDRIEDVGPWENIKTKWQDAPVTNLGDVTLMPGLFDCHVHLQMDPSGTNTSTDIALPDDELFPLMQRNASKLLDAGVTTARDLGARGMTAITLREMIKDGTIPGPRLQCANAPLTVAGGHAHSMGGVCEGIEGVRAEVRKRVAEGADLIKVMATGGFMTAGSHPSKARFSQVEMDAIADEAKKAGLPITTHATGTEGIERAADARFNSIEHCAWISSDGKAIFDRAVARKLVEYDIAVCPTTQSIIHISNHTIIFALKMHFSAFIISVGLMAAGSVLAAPNLAIERTPVAESIANATAMGVDVYGVIPDDAVKVTEDQYTAEPGTKAWAWIRAQIDLPNTDETRRQIEKRQGWANIGIGMFSQDWCNDQAGWVDNVIYGYNCYVDSNMYSVGISYRGLRSNEQLDFSRLSGNDWCRTYLHSAGHNTPTGCFNSQAINCFRLTVH
ncbi:amidohydrolase [Colletotrichum gloeosporioides Cg-14]|uniref:Amidohydrolase n=1 Tax=Colletotrichum gloeosporioides (strain Cg-14) TaxID=1237896 RepID=T0KNF9_COLGC|nr:amidohydrolase [Colletotrichum gloeosporioides Cg-14]